MAEKTVDKDAFFKALEQLDCLTDDSENEADIELSHIIKRSRYSDKIISSNCRKDTPPFKLLRATSAPQSTSASVSDSSTHSKMLAPGSDVLQPGVKRSNTTGTLAGHSEADKQSKRRRVIAPRTVPEEQQIFKNLVFFFFPNNDVSPLRRLRIQRAQEYGAIWAKTWEAHVTHVIVDKGLMFQDVLKHLKLEAFPPNVALLDESYPSECIRFKSVLSTTLVRFRVRGASCPEAEEMNPTNETPSTGSLPLKPSRKKQATPTPSQDSRDQCIVNPAPEQPVEALSDEIHPEQPVPEPSSRERDALDDMVEAAKAAKDLPLDPLEEDSVEANDTEASDASDTESVEKKESHLSKEDKMVEAWQQKFACMQKHDSNSKLDNPNCKTIEVLQQMLDYYTRTSDQWRPRLADKIEEIVFTNRLRRLENANNTPEDLVLQEFLGVYGAGISQASRWIAQGYRSLDDLKTKASLTKSQRIGVEHYHDFAQRIPRREVEAHGEIVRKAVQKADPGMQVIIGGSYRRGASDSGDIDLLITKGDATIEQITAMMMDTVIPRLFQDGFLQVSLASTSRSDGSKWHGASVLPGSKIWRRIDLLFVPGSEIGAALIYFTGNDIFNRSMRLLASKKGMRLNQRGLYADVLRGELRKKLSEGRLLDGRDERRIFEILGVPWRPPEHRIC
ncbi:DNA-directed DNA polymerase IV [Aspergillus fischeri NRRL 181]|uniref:DNA polymerase n=1 Tax=Neosartorya fischeri (strain ATCC 1020 / DSM 3700 / CBS 544.65 / FGSC A1164 / JCM 1740 / NRRL 181 / WB 181) TaxID=331117 RepID=A1D331_NEOFI|nr:DNA polymerase POL4, putative [Aspergillus fischeri NRRL 181]EAW22824.1 DNA polymerase POL4, putative [Aspergillus fischeri NRRL 181]